MRLVSNQPAGEIQKRQEEAKKVEALKKVEASLRQLAANIMRVTRGAGASYDLPGQMAECLIAMRDYREVVGCGVASFEMDQMLDPDRAAEEHNPNQVLSEEALQEREDSGRRDVELAEARIHRACLQITASTLVNQPLQIARGESDLASALRYWEVSVERRRAIHQAQAKSSTNARGTLLRLKRKTPDVEL